MKGNEMPTVIGQPRIMTEEKKFEPSFVPSDTSTLVPASMAANIAPEMLVQIQSDLSKMDFTSMTLQQIAFLGNEAEMGIQATLDGFLSKVDRYSSPLLFQLVNELNSAVSKEDLPAIADRIMSNEVGFADKFKAKFTKGGLAKVAAEAWEELKRLLQGKTKNLVDVIAKMEKDLNTQSALVADGIKEMDSLSEAYKDHFEEFVYVAALMAAFLQRAQAQVTAIEATIPPNDMAATENLMELKDKLQALESRALSLEGTMTRLPADNLVVRQLRTSGIQTLQEVTTTAQQRFASIKMTLITLNNALTTKGLQQLSAVGASLDNNLLDIRSKITTQVAKTAANAPGDNRLQQAEQIKKIVADTTALYELVEEAKKENSRKFAETRNMFETARKDILALGNKATR